MRIAVLGNEAVGNLIGGLLAVHGEQVFIICNDDMHINAIANQGLWIQGAAGIINARLQAGYQLVDRPDICLLNTSLTDIVPALTEYKELLKDVPVVTLQSSPRAADYAASVLGKQYILSAAVLFGANLSAGHVTYPVAGNILLVSPSTRPASRSRSSRS